VAASNISFAYLGCLTMSSMGDALSGFDQGENEDKRQARHSNFIGALLQKTTKIQREMRGRRYKVR
jgi:hypothetical protein